MTSSLLDYEGDWILVQATRRQEHIALPTNLEIHWHIVKADADPPTGTDGGTTAARFVVYLSKNTSITAALECPSRRTVTDGRWRPQNGPSHPCRRTRMVVTVFRWCRWFVRHGTQVTES